MCVCVCVCVCVCMHVCGVCVAEKDVRQRLTGQQSRKDLRSRKDVKTYTLPFRLHPSLSLSLFFPLNILILWETCCESDPVLLYSLSPDKRCVCVCVCVRVRVCDVSCNE